MLAAAVAAPAYAVSPGDTLSVAVLSLAGPNGAWTNVVVRVTNNSTKGHPANNVAVTLVTTAADGTAITLTVAAPTSGSTTIPAQGFVDFTFVGNGTGGLAIKRDTGQAITGEIKATATATDFDLGSTTYTLPTRPLTVALVSSRLSNKVANFSVRVTNPAGNPLTKVDVSFAALATNGGTAVPATVPPSTVQLNGGTAGVDNVVTTAPVVQVTWGNAGHQATLQTSGITYAPNIPLSTTSASVTG